MANRFNIRFVELEKAEFFNPPLAVRQEGEASEAIAERSPHPRLYLINGGVALSKPVLSAVEGAKGGGIFFAGGLRMEKMYSGRRGCEFRKWR
jgi:hypothetical protein